MFKKMKLKKAIVNCEKEIEELEKKRYRSQAALVAAILENKDADDKDVDYFNSYSVKIEEKRNEIRELQKELEAL